MLSDPDTKVATRWGAFGEKIAYGRTYRGIYRMTFLIDEQRKINYIFEKVTPVGHANEVLKKLNEIN